MRISDWSSDVCSSDLAMMRRMLMCDVRVFGSILLIRFDFIDRKNVRECSEVRKADGSQNSSRVISPSKDVIRMSMSSRKIKYRSEEHTSELQSLMRISYAVFCLKKKMVLTIYELTPSDIPTIILLYVN